MLPYHSNNTNYLLTNEVQTAASFEHLDINANVTLNRNEDIRLVWPKYHKSPNTTQRKEKSEILLKNNQSEETLPAKENNTISADNAGNTNIGNALPSKGSNWITIVCRCIE